MELQQEYLIQSLRESLPELEAPLQQMFAIEFEGAELYSECGFIVYEDILTKYLQILLLMPPSEKRALLLRQAFQFIEKLLWSEEDAIKSFIWVSVFEDRRQWWMFRALEFFGPKTALLVKQKRGEIDQLGDGNEELPASQELIDEYGVRIVIFRQFGDEHLQPSQIPGVTPAWPEENSEKPLTQEVIERCRMLSERGVDAEDVLLALTDAGFPPAQAQNVLEQILSERH